MKDIKALREFKRIKNMQKAKRGAMLWSSVLVVALAVYFAFPASDGSVGTFLCVSGVFHCNITFISETHSVGSFGIAFCDICYVDSGIPL